VRNAKCKMPGRVSPFAGSFCIFHSSLCI